MRGHDRRARSGGHPWGDREPTARAPLILGEQGDEGLLERRGTSPPLQLRRRAGGEDAALVHGDQPVEPGGLVHVGRGHDHAHRGAIATDVVDQRPELLSRERVDAGRGLVEDQQVGVVDERGAEPHLLLHAPREFAGGAVVKGGEAGRLEQAGDPRAPFRRPLAEEPGEEVDVFKNAQLHREVLAEPLRHEGDPRTDGVAVPQVGNVAAEHDHAAGLDPLGSGDQAEQRRLADAVGADQPDHLACGNINREVADCRRVAEPVGDTRDRRNDAR